MALFLGWLFLVVLVPVVAALVPEAPPWAAYLPAASAGVALASVAGVVRPRSLNPFRWALDVAATAATVIPSRATSTPATPPKEP